MEMPLFSRIRTEDIFLRGRGYGRKGLTRGVEARLNCKRHGVVKGRRNLNSDSYCPKCMEERGDLFSHHVSMGTQVSSSDCSYCREGGIICDHRSAISPQWNFSISLVPSPKCERCGKKMVPHGDLKWVCQNDSCEKEGVPIYNGVHPLRQVDDGML